VGEEEILAPRPAVSGSELITRVDPPDGSYQFRVCGFGVRAPPPLTADDRDHAGQRPRRQRVPERSGGLISPAKLHDTFSKVIAPGQGYQGDLLLDRSDRRPPTLATRRGAGAILGTPAEQRPVPEKPGHARESRPLSLIERLQAPLRLLTIVLVL
jgi:hypothetical protein